MSQTARYIDTADVAKRIRAHLKSVFPGITFSVTLKRYSGGSSIRIRWTDGPTDREVSGVVQQYRAGDFDGMTDSYNYRQPSLVATDTGLETVRYGVGFVFTERKLTAAYLRPIVERVCTHYCCGPAPEVTDGYFGAEIKGGWDRYVLTNTQGSHYWTLQAVAHRVAEGEDL